jgi:hypothetical protein
MRSLTKEIRSGWWDVRRFRLCANVLECTWCGYKLTGLMLEYFLFKKLHNGNVVTLSLLPSPIPIPLHANLPQLKAMLQVVLWSQVRWVRWMFQHGDLVLRQNVLTDVELWAGALFWWRTLEPFFHISGLLLLNRSRRVDGRLVSRLRSYHPVCT